MSENQNFTEGRILVPLMKFAGPVFLAMLLQAMYGAVDLLIVGHFAETADISAVATGSLLMMSLTSMLVSFSMGLTVLLGQRIGQKRGEEAGEIIGSGICLFALIAVLMMVVLVPGAGTISQLLNAPKDAFAQTTDYIRICSAGIACIIAYNVLGSIFRGIGDSKMPLITVAISCVINVLLDLLFIAVFHKGAAGGALATVIAQAISVLISFLIIRNKEKMFSFSIRSIRWNGKNIRQMVLFGIPMALQDLLVSISFMVIMIIVNGLGMDESAGVGVAEKVCGFLMLIPAAYMQSLSAFVAQNIGADKPERARKALFYAIGTSFAAALVMGYLGIFQGEFLSGLFCKDPVVIALSAQYLKAYGIDCLLTAELFCFCGFFSGMGKTTFVMLQGIFGAFAIRIPIAYFMSRQSFATLFHIGLSTPASTTVQIIICGIYFAVIMQKKKG